MSSKNVNENEVFQNYMRRRTKKYEDVVSFIKTHKIPHIPNRAPARVTKTHGVPFTYDEWYYENEDNLLDLWDGIQEMISDRNMYMLDKCGFHHLCSFVASRTTLDKNPYMVLDEYGT